MNPRVRISQYGHTAWRLKDGFFNGTPNAIAQTTDGFVWIGTSNGLVRFDGVRFVPWDSPNQRRLPPSSRIYSLLAGSDGSLWIGTQTNLFRWKQGNLTNFETGQGRISSIIEDRNGRVWIARSRPKDDDGPLCQVREARLQCYGNPDGIKPRYATSLAEDGDGNLWIGSATFVTRWKPGSASEYAPPGLRSKGLNGVSEIVSGRDGSMWVGMITPGPGLGLQHIVQGVWHPFVAPGFDSSTLQVSALFLDREKALWVGTDNKGIYRIHEGSVDQFSAADGLSSDTIQGFYEDREGNLWLTTPEGIDCFRDLRIVTYSMREGLMTNRLGSVVASADGTIWSGNQGALESLKDGRISAISPKDGLPGDNITSLLEDHSGRLWVGVDDKLSVYENGRFQPVRGARGVAIGATIGMTEDADHSIWANILGRKLVHIQGREVRGEFSSPELSVIISLAADPNGGLWLGLSNGELARYRNGHLEKFQPKNRHEGPVRSVIVAADGSVLAAAGGGIIVVRNGTLRELTSRNGLPCEQASAIIPSKDGALWLYAECGLIRIGHSEMERWWGHPEAAIGTTLYDAFDGVRTSSTPFQPPASVSPDGRLWFANSTVLQMIDPEHLTSNEIAPPIHIEEIIADRRHYSPGKDLSLPALTRDLEIDYTALSFVVPQKVRFRYMLEGHDPAWQEPGSRRQAFYNDLRPGPYRFRVIACNNDGVWNEQGDLLTFSIAPAWYQTFLFRFICVLASLAFLWSIYQLRLRRLKTQFNMTLEARVSERTRIARELHDTLLQSFSALLLRFQSVSKMLPSHPDEAKQRVEGAIEQASSAIAEGRDAVHELRSGALPAADLKESIGSYAAELLNSTAGGHPPEFRIHAEGVPRPLNPMVRDEAYRIAAEALRNAIRYSEARLIEVEIRYDEQHLLLRIRDDGKGIDPGVLEQGYAPGHWGLRGMRERARLLEGSFEVWSEADSGTEVKLTVPAASAFAQPASRWSILRKKLTIADEYET